MKEKASTNIFDDIEGLEEIQQFEYFREWIEKGYSKRDAAVRERMLEMRMVQLEVDPDLDSKVPLARNITEKFWVETGLN